MVNARKLSLWVPVIIHMGIIFYFSSQPAGSPSLQKFPLPAGLGHFVGYFLLAGLLYRALAGNLFQWNFHTAKQVLLISVLYGISDEIHQLYVPGRNASVLDVITDGAGAATSLAVIRSVFLLKNTLKQKQGKSREILASKFKKD